MANCTMKELGTLANEMVREIERMASNAGLGLRAHDYLFSMRDLETAVEFMSDIAGTVHDEDAAHSRLYLMVQYVAYKRHAPRGFRFVFKDGTTILASKLLTWLERIENADERRDYKTPLEVIDDRADAFLAKNGLSTSMHDDAQNFIYDLHTIG